MLKGLFSADGKFYAITSKIVDLVIVTLLWIVGCLPVVTLLTSTASMYHTVVKCIRYDRGSVFGEFKEAYRKNLRQGIGLTVLYGTAGALIAFADYHVFVVSVDRSDMIFVLGAVLLILSAVYLLNVLWLVPVFSRFSDTFGKIIKLNYVIAMRHLVRSVAMLLVVAAAAVLVLASNESLIILPAVVLLINSYLSETALRRYMPRQEEDNGDWRYGFQ